MKYKTHMHCARARLFNWPNISLKYFFQWRINTAWMTATSHISLVFPYPVLLLFLSFFVFFGLTQIATSSLLWFSWGTKFFKEILKFEKQIYWHNNKARNIRKIPNDHSTKTKNYYSIFYRIYKVSSSATSDKGFKNRETILT